MHIRPAPRLPLVRFIERRSRTQRILAGVVVGIVASWQLVRSAARTLLDRWWLDSVTDSPIWARRTAAQLQLGFGAATVVALVLGTSVWIALRSKDRPEHRFWIRYHERVGPAHRWALIAVVVYLVWHIGHTATGEWQHWLLFRHGSDIGVEVPELGSDLGFHLFRLPLLATTSSFLRELLLFTLVVSAFAHAANGGLRLPGGGRRQTAVAVTHLSLLTAGLLAVQAWHDVVVARAETATNRIGSFDGPGFTEISVTRPALLLAGFASIIAGFAVVQSSRSGRWRATQAIAIAVVLVHAVGLVVAPALSERFIVQPAEAERQLWSIEHNLDATLAAYDLSDVAIGTADLADRIDDTRTVDTRSADTRTADTRIGALGGVPLFSASQLAHALQILVGTPGTRITDVDILPYPDGETTRPIYVGARSANRADLPERGWVQEHLVYTHGDGLIALAADVADADGRPDLTPLPGYDQVEHTPLYYGEQLEGWYAVTGTRRTEYSGNRYDGTGVGMGSVFRRAVLSLVVGESQPLFSSEFGDDAMLLFRRGLRERITAIAPFLTLDSDPYPIVDGDRVIWVVDAYTTSDHYPYAQSLPKGIPSGSPLASARQNYIRASVVVTIDASTGEVHFVRRDGGDDPILDAWSKVFPDLFESADRLDERLRRQLRYPGDLFSVQTTMLGRYHVADAETLFNGSDRWSVSTAAASKVGEQANGPAPAVDIATDDGLASVRTYGPGAPGRPTTTREELAGIAVGTHGERTELRLDVPVASGLLSPQVAQSAIDADPRLAQEITLLNANGSKVEFGPMTPLVLDGSLSWVRPITVTGTSPASVPRLYGVAVVSGGLVGLGPTVAEALADVGQSSAE